MVATITAFTIAHSVTLAGAALEIVRVPQQFVEAMIALSIAVAAAEVIRDRYAKGIELGQLAFVALVAGLVALSNIRGSLAQRVPRTAVAYGIGVVAVFWTIARMATF